MILDLYCFYNQFSPLFIFKSEVKTLNIFTLLNKTNDNLICNSNTYSRYLMIRSMCITQVKKLI